MFNQFLSLLATRLPHPVHLSPNSVSFHFLFPYSSFIVTVTQLLLLSLFNLLPDLFCVPNIHVYVLFTGMDSQDRLNVPAAGGYISRPATERPGTSSLANLCDDSVASGDSAKSIRNRQFRNCFSILEGEIELEAANDKQKSTRSPGATPFKGFKRRLKKPRLFRTNSRETSATNFYDAENKLLEMEQGVDASDDESEICTLRREESQCNMRRTLWSRDSIADPAHRSSLPALEKMLLDASLENKADVITKVIQNAAGHKNFIDCTDELGRTALHLASACGNSCAVKILLENGAQVEVWDSGNVATPLMCAASSGCVETLKVLLKWNADINTGYENGRTALYWACSEGHYACVKVLLENGAKQSATAIFSETPLHLVAAATIDNPELIKLLLEHGADVTLLNGPERNTALHVAAQEYNTESCKLLVHAGSAMNARNSRGLTPLHFAAFENPKLTEFLLISGADPNITDKEGRSPLFYAVGKGELHNECLELLLTHHAKVNLQDHCGYTALHIASIKEVPGSASILLRHGSDLTIRNMARQTGLMLFTRRVPGAMDIYKQYLNDSITITNINYKANVKLDFSPLVPNQITKPVRKRTERKGKRGSAGDDVRIETDLLRSFLNHGEEDVLLHPLVEAFLQLKWQRLRKFFLLSFIMQLILVLSYSSFILEMYKVRCPYRVVMANATSSIAGTNATTEMMTNRATEMVTTEMTTTEMTTPEMAIEASSTKMPENGITTEGKIEQSNFTVMNLTLLFVPGDQVECGLNSVFQKFTWGFVIILSACNIIKELIQFAQCPGAYVRSQEKWGLAFFLATLSISLIPPSILIQANQREFLRLQYPIAAVGVCLAWGLMFIQIGRFPSVGLYVQMLVKVGSNFVTFIIVYACIFIAFAMSFSILFPAEKTFGSFFEILLKLIRILTGDVNLEYILYDVQSPVDIKSQMPSVLTANIVHTTCVIVLSIVLMNLLVGLAVNDIQGLYRTAKLKKLARQAELIAYLESFILSKRFLYILPSSLRNLLLKSVVVAPSYYKCFFYFHPNDKDDKRLPEELKSAIIRLKEQNSLDKSNSFKENFVVKEDLKRLENQLRIIQSNIETLVLRQYSQS